MALEVVVTTNRWKNDPASRELVEFLQSKQELLGLENSILYYDFPSYSDYEAAIFRPDILLFGPKFGFVAVRFYDEGLFQRSGETLEDIDLALDDFVSNLHARLIKSRSLRSSRTSTIVSINSVIINLNDGSLHDAEIESLKCSSINGFGELLLSLNTDTLGEDAVSEVRSVVEGAKALSRASKRVVHDPANQPLAALLRDIEGSIANFDEKQRHIALVDVGGPARIRGLAGSGKTVILAMKAAHLHLNDPEATILFTFLTKSLRATIKALITKFYRVYSDNDPDWKRIHIRHGWGGRSTPGVYSEACTRSNHMPLALPAARKLANGGEGPFGAICRELLRNARVAPYYDHVLIDEGQDFPDSFYKLAYTITKGERDKKSIVWAYDELQDIMNVKIRQPDELFGFDERGVPNVDLDRSGQELPPGATNDAVLSRAYRNQRDVLVSAHSLGFGVYGQIVQMLESSEHWEDVGYNVLSGPLVVGETVSVTRPDANSPISIGDTPGFPLIAWEELDSFNAEVDWVTEQIATFLSAGLNPEDILVISLDDKHAKGYLKRIGEQLALNAIASNNVIADPFNEPPFTISGKVTLSTVYRAKGNEAAVVCAVGTDAVELRSRSGRNKLFTAFTRTKAWLRVSGIGVRSRQVGKELDAARELSPQIDFTMPDLEQIETIQRGFTKKQQIAHEAKKKYLEQLKAAGFSDDEIEEELKGNDVIE